MSKIKDIHMLGEVVALREFMALIAPNIYKVKDELDSITATVYSCGSDFGLLIPMPSKW